MTAALVCLALMVLLIAWPLIATRLPPGGELVGRMKVPVVDARWTSVYLTINRKAPVKAYLGPVVLFAFKSEAVRRIELLEAPEASRIADAIDAFLARPPHLGAPQLAQHEMDDPPEGIYIDALDDEGGERRVGVGMSIGQKRINVCMSLSPAQAGELSELLRIAASPGSNVAQARWHLKHGAGD